MKFSTRSAVQKFILIMTFSSFLPGMGSVSWANTQASDVKVMMDYWAPYYRPALAIVPDGVSIHIVNPTSSPHTLTHEGCRRSGSCAFDTGAVQPGQEFTLPSLPPGRYSYYCVLHPIMKGEIVILPQNPVLSQVPRSDPQRPSHTTRGEPSQR